MSTNRGQYLIGKTIDAYVLEQLLGHGGTSAVFLARHQETGQQAAVKVFLPRSTMTPQAQREFYQRFLREAKAVSTLSHPHILPISSYGTQDGFPYIIMPYMPGGTLASMISEHGLLSLNAAQHYLEQVASALDYAHAHGFVHCDVKPANILLDGNNNAILSDFGIAHMIPIDEAGIYITLKRDAGQAGTPTGQTALKTPGTLMGTPDYISPEQALGYALDGRTDIYSLGITLFYLLSGHVPFRADSSVAVALLQVHAPAPALGLERADISPYIDEVIRRALSKQPGDRYQSAKEFSNAFTEAVRLSESAYHVDPNNTPALIQYKRIKPVRGEHAQPTPRIFARMNVGAQKSGAFPSRQGVLPSQHVMPNAPLNWRASRLPQILLAIALILLLTVGTVVAAGFFTSHFNNNRVQGTVPAGLGSNRALIDNLTHDNDWPTGGAFSFSRQQYEINNISHRYAALALYANHQYSDFHLSITASEKHGTLDGADYYGVVFRAAADQSHYYIFEVSSWGGGQYQFLRYDGNGHWKTLAGGILASFYANKGESNTITIQATRSTFHFLVDNNAIGSAITDTSAAALLSGEIGLYVEEEGTEIAFSHLYINSL
jgi:serine/threonine protein kinase